MYHTTSDDKKGGNGDTFAVRPSPPNEPSHEKSPWTGSNRLWPHAKLDGYPIVRHPDRQPWGNALDATTHGHGKVRTKRCCRGALISVIELSGVSKSYDGRNFVLEEIDLAVGQEELILISGRNGSGKTTLLNLMGLLDSPTEGVVSIDGRDVSKLSDGELSKMRLLRIGFVFQDHNLIEEITLKQNVLLPLKLAKAEKMDARVEELLEAFGLEDLGGRKPMEISVGQRQLAAIARALANEPRVILADEPTASLDEENSATITEALERVNREMGTAVVMTHHEALPGDGLMREMVLEGGRLVQLPPGAGP